MKFNSIKTKILAQSVGAVVITALILVGIILLQKRSIDSESKTAKGTVDNEIKTIAKLQSTAAAQDVYRMCQVLNDSVLQKLEGDLNVARQAMTNAGGVTFSSEEVSWDVINQFTKESKTINLPKVMLGESWLGKTKEASSDVPVVDRVTKCTGTTCTIFQRMNEDGDMLRVATSVMKLDGTRAIGTYIPAKNPDGSPNAVVSTVLRGETFKGRAFVVNAWYITAYEPIKNSEGKVIGVLYVGVKQEMVDALRQGIMDMVVGKTGYVFVLGGKGDLKGQYLISKGGKRDGDNIWEAKDSSGRLFIQEIINTAVGMNMEGSVVPIEYIRYPWKNKGDKEARMKISAYTYFAPWDWVIGAGTYEDDYEEMQQNVAESFGGILMASNKMVFYILVVSAVLCVVMGVISYVLAGAISGPVTLASSLFQEVAKGDLTKRLTTKSKDEVGVMAQSFNGFVDKLQGIIKNLAENTRVLASSSTEFGATSNQMAVNSEEVSSQMGTVASASEELSATGRTMAASAEEISASINNAASAVEEMSASISEVAKNCTKESEIAGRANDQARQTSEVMARLGESAQEITKVVEIIRSIADQTNLLALNATIEAASAGEAGKGFAVVANEVKELARQSAQATEQITQQIEAIQKDTKASVEAMDAITKVIEEINNIATTIAAAVEEQSATVNEIAKTMGGVSQATGDMSKNIQQSSTSTQEVSQNIQGVTQAVEQTAKGTIHINSSAQELTKMADQLKQIVDQFKV